MSTTILPMKRILGPGDPVYEPQVDPRARSVRVLAGTPWDEVDAATRAHGLATPGEIGHLTRRFGLGLDSLLEAEVVLVDGRTVRASADEHPGLYWALRGGAELGFVRSAVYRLHELGPVVGGPTFWPVEHARAVLDAYRDFLPAAPRTLTGAFTLRTVGFPEDRRVCGVLWCAASQAEIDPFLDALPEPLLHGVQPLPHTVLRRAFATDGERSYLRELPAALPQPLTLYPLDGAVRDVAPGDTAWAHRDARWCAVSERRLSEPRAARSAGEDEIAGRLAAMRAAYLGGSS